MTLSQQRAKILTKANVREHRNTKLLVAMLQQRSTSRGTNILVQWHFEQSFCTAFAENLIPAYLSEKSIKSLLYQTSCNIHISRR